MSAGLAVRPLEAAQAAPRTEIRTTLLALVEAVTEVSDNEEEVVATVRHMLRSGRIRLCGNFRDEPTDRF